MGWRWEIRLVNEYGDTRTVEVGEEQGKPITVAQAQAFAVEYANENNDPPVTAWGASMVPPGTTWRVE